MKRIPRKTPSMTTKSISVTLELGQMMDMHPEVNWSAVCREAIARALKQLNQETDNGPE